MMPTTKKKKILKFQSPKIQIQIINKIQIPLQNLMIIMNKNQNQMKIFQRGLHKVEMTKPNYQRGQTLFFKDG